jgi:hypothetical protein
MDLMSFIQDLLSLGVGHYTNGCVVVN